MRPTHEQNSLDQILADYDDQAPLTLASTIPAPWYTDPAVAALERAAVFGQGWQLAARLDQLTRPGQYVTCEVAGEPIVLVRGDDGVLRGFFNVCRHHAAAVMTLPAGQAAQLRCPYHGWTYGLDGALKGVPEFGGVCNFDRAQQGLLPVPVAIWEKFAFVSLAANPPPLADWLGDLVRRVAGLGLASLHFAERRVFSLACNWKVFVDNYLDGGYHVPHLHKGLNSILDYNHYTIEIADRFCLQSSPIGPPNPGSSEADGGDDITASVRQGQAQYFWLYPNLMLNWYQGYLDTNLVIPLGPDRTQVVFEFFFADVSPEASERNRRSMDVSERIQDEDHAICESVQKGLGSRAYRQGRLSVRREAGEHLFHQLLARDLRAGRLRR